ncbi:MAG: hypothetical protein ABSE05_10275 [Syntrophales bacterium]|jgi:hypothetical protein
MIAKATSLKIEVLDNNFDFNWARVMISEPSPEGAEFTIQIEMKVPKTIKDLGEINTYVLDRAKRIDLTNL